MTSPHIAMIGVPAHQHENPHLPVLAERVARRHRVDISSRSGFAPGVAARTELAARPGRGDGPHS
jgi:hypothetical protein